MSELTEEEKKYFNGFIDELMSNLDCYPQIAETYNEPDYSYEYQFLFQRVKIAASNNTRSLLKTLKELKLELRPLRALKLQNPFIRPNILNIDVGEPNQDPPF